MNRIRFPRKIEKNLQVFGGLTLWEIVPLGVAVLCAAGAFLSRLLLAVRAGIALTFMSLGFILAFGRKDGIRLWRYAVCRLRFAVRPRGRAWGKKSQSSPRDLVWETASRSSRRDPVQEMASWGKLTISAVLLLAGVILFVAAMWEISRQQRTGGMPAAAAPPPTKTATPTNTPTATPTPTKTPTPTPTETVYFFDDFDDEEASLGWSASLEQGSRAWIVKSRIVTLGIEDLEEGDRSWERYFPILYRNDLFPPEGSFELDFAFRYHHVRENGIDVGISSAPERGHYYWEERALWQEEPRHLDILDIHQVHTPDSFPASRRRFRIKLLRGPEHILWEGRGLPDTRWHMVKLTCQENTPPGSYLYTLYVDGELVGETISTLRPVSFYAGHKLGKWGGGWTRVSVDYVRVTCDWRSPH